MEAISLKDLNQKLSNEDELYKEKLIEKRTEL